MPRSASRDLADRLSGLRRFFQKWNRLERWKMYASLAALVLCAGWGLASIAFRKLDYQASHGELARVHQAWSSECEACHRNGRKHLLDADGRWNTFDCSKCHFQDGVGKHHDSAKIEGQTCADCHHDHGGKDVSLVKMDDRACTSCHGDLPAHTEKSKSKTDPPYQSFTSFASGHPEFRSLPPTKERGLRFSHGRHMTPGQVMNLKDVKSAKRLGAIPEAYRAAYGTPDQPLDSIVQLDCKSCHQLDGERGKPKADAALKALTANGMPAEPIIPARPAGAAFLPVNYENHCKACHPTDVPVDSIKMISEDGQPIPQTVTSSFSVPHRLSFEELRKTMVGKYSAMLQEPGTKLNQRFNETFTMKMSRPEQVKTYADEAAKYAENGMRYMMTTSGCVYCHQRDGDKFIPTAIPTIWMSHARFDHASHRAAKCSECHPGTDAKVTNGVLEREDPAAVKIAGIENCRKCHNSSAGVRSGCIDCHTYHHGDSPLQGRGAPDLGPKATYTIGDFLKGK